MITLSILHLRSECVDFSTPPPPASSLTRFDRHCYNHLSCHHLSCHSLTSLLLVLFFSLGLVACQSGGSSASSANNDETISVNDGSDSSGNDDSDINGDKTPTLVDNSDIVFSSVDNSKDTKVGMREFLLTVTYNNLNTKQELNFIVGESTTPPTWNSVKANPTKITRAFNNGNLKTRRIYFSATEKLTDVSFDADGNATITGQVIDLSQDGQTEAQITKAQAPGIMAPSTSYYVYVYDNRGALVKQQKVTTAGYPTDASSFTTQVGAVGGRTSGASPDEYIWGMDAWRDANGNYQIVKDVEVKKGEVFFLPLRTRSVVDWDVGVPNGIFIDGIEGIKNSYCVFRTDETLRIFEGKGGSAPGAIFTFTPSGVDKEANLFSFTSSPKIFPNSLPTMKTNQTFDFVYLSQVGGTGQEVIYSLFETCLGNAGQSLIDDGTVQGFSFTLITE